MGRGVSPEMAQQDALDVEAREWALFEKRIRRAVQDVGHIAHQGDGNCGALVDALIGICKEAGLYKKPAPYQGYKKRRIPNSLRTQVFERDAYRCVSCGTHKDLRVDHIHPESAGGADTLENLQTLCARCNSVKGRSIPSVPGGEP